MPRIEEYQPARIEDELPDLVYYTVDTSAATAAPDHRERRHADVERLRQHRQGPLSRRLSRRAARPDRDAGLPRMHRPRACPSTPSPTSTTSTGGSSPMSGCCCRSRKAGGVTHIIASLKTISEDGGFEIKNLMRGNDNAAGAETSHHHRPRPVPPRARPHSVRRRDRIQLARWNSKAPIPRWSDRSSSACC